MFGLIRLILGSNLSCHDSEDRYFPGGGGGGERETRYVSTLTSYRLDLTTMRDLNKINTIMSNSERAVSLQISVEKKNVQPSLLIV